MDEQRGLGPIYGSFRSRNIEGREGKKKPNRGTESDISQQRFRCFSVSLDEGQDDQKKYQWNTQRESSSLSVRVARTREGRPGLRLAAASRHGSGCYQFFEFFEGDGGVRIGHRKVGDQHEIQDSNSNIELTVQYYSVERNFHGDVFDLHQQDEEIFKKIEEVSYQGSGRPPRLSILLNGWEKIDRALDCLTRLWDANPLQGVPKSWWKSRLEFRRVLQAVVKHEYEESKKTQITVYGLVGEFEKLALQPKNEETAERLAKEARDIAGSSKEEAQRTTPQTQRNSKPIYRIKLRPGPTFRAPRDESGRLVEIKIHQGQKYYLRWPSGTSGKFYERVCAVSAEDAEIANTSVEILYSMVVCFPEGEVPKAQTFTVAGRPDKTTYQRIKAALKAIDTAPENSPATAIYKSVLLGEPSQALRQSDTAKEIYQQVLAETLDASQQNAAETALSYNFTVVQGPPGTGKTTTITTIQEAYIRAKTARRQNPDSADPSAHILVTAPTNSAVNHLAKQWKQRVLADKSGLLKQFTVVRWVPDGFYRPVKNTNGGSKERKEVELEYEDGSDDDEEDDDVASSLMLEIADSVKGDFPSEYSIMNHRKAHPRWDEYESLFIEVLAGGVAAKEKMSHFSEVRADIDFEILKKATIVFSTAMGAGTYQVRRYFPAGLVIVDEAGQATEPLAAVPMCIRDMEHFVLVGDHVQLPPLSKYHIPILGMSLLEKLAGFRKRSIEEGGKKGISAPHSSLQRTENVEERRKVEGQKNRGREQIDPEELDADLHVFHEESEADNSFERPANTPPDALKIQWGLLQNNYRSRPRIVDLISKFFYEGQLQDQNLDFFNWYFDPQKNRPYYRPAILWQEIYQNSDTKNQNTQSYYNLCSIYPILDLLYELETKGREISVNDVAIIPMYSSQVSLLRAAVKKFLLGPMRNIRIDTVESFQGQEKKYIIVDLVRSNKNGDIGFIHDVRRLNVAISRGMEKTIIVGDRTMFTRPRFNNRQNPILSGIANEVTSTVGAVRFSRPQGEYRERYPGLEQLAEA
ncbi:hypothetical protein TWF718_003375 [Orbilia javanica]|uniref:AAA+ ATPase domain-containing protein n=1 Tax=Orbilia javanica TaxID=47235 RepID=A0AAN8MEQ6_9PEZI